MMWDAVIEINEIQIHGDECVSRGGRKEGVSEERVGRKGKGSMWRSGADDDPHVRRRAMVVVVCKVTV